ncbi:unnamed protein product [Effrenium voratum]|nr:unnamed protein product [Effrenium voratum]
MDAPPPPPPAPPPLHRTVSAGGIPVFRGGDIVVKNRPDLNFDGLKPAPDRVWLGNMTFEIASEEWTVDKFLNYGAEGQTYLVTRSGTGERFAAKFCSKEDSMEVKLVQDLPRQLVKHENFIKYELIVLNVHGIFAPAHHIIFMEHIPNGELFDVLASQEPSVAGKPLNEGTSRRFLKDIISGMAECYRYGVTHRDLKPENLLINENGKIVIIDMGHAKRVVEPPGAPPNPLALSRTTTSNPYGTPAFNAPEVSAGKSYDCEWSDVWSVGVIAFYLHGKLPAFQAGGGVADWKDVSGPANDKLWRKIAAWIRSVFWGRFVGFQRLRGAFFGEFGTPVSLFLFWLLNVHVCVCVHKRTQRPFLTFWQTVSPAKQPGAFFAGLWAQR